MAAAHDYDSSIAEMLEHLDIQTFLDYEGIEYQEKMGGSGPQLNMKYCPACGDAKWRTWLNAETGLGNCFRGSCQKGYNKWVFIREYLGNPPNAEVVQYIERLVGEMGWRPKPKPKATTPIGVPLCELPSGCIALPDVNGNNLAYLEERGINGELCREFGLLYCDHGYYSAANPIREREEQYYGKRVIIPLFDLHGSRVNFQGRDITGKSARKYLFPPGLPASGKYLYAGHLVQGKEEVAVGEGVFDAISLTAAFREDPDLSSVGAVATYGMHLSDGEDGNNQVSYFLTLKRLGLKRVTFMWDSEKAALKRAFDAATKLSGLGLKARVAVLPTGKDPNDASQREVVQAYYSAHDVSTPAGRRDLLRQLL